MHGWRMMIDEAKCDDKDCLVDDDYDDDEDDD